MDVYNNNLNNSMTIIFEGNFKDFDGIECPCQWKIPTYPLESLKSLISRFFQISGLDPKCHKLYYNNKIINKDSSDSLSQKGLINNSRIQVSAIIFESYVSYAENNKDQYFDFNIFIKFIKLNQNSVFNCNKDLRGILKLCLLNEISSKLDEQALNYIKATKDMNTIYYILKILNKSYQELNFSGKTKDDIMKIMSKENKRNILNFSNYVDSKINKDVLQWIINFLKGNKLQEINDIKLHLGKYEIYYSLFEKEFDRALRNSVFEFSAVSLVVIDRQDYDTFERERQKCPNRVDRILFHGTQIQPISSILTGLFRKSINSGYQHGKGVYFTDSLDNCWFYGGVEGKRANMNIIPKVGDTFTCIASLVYYDKRGFLQVEDYKTRIQPGKNQINFAYAGCELETIKKPDFKTFVGTEYVVWELDQICPYISIKFKREEYCVIWRDNNLSEEAIHKSEFDKVFKDFLKERIKYIKQSAKYNIYPCKTTDEALKIVNRKKYNKIILLSNIGPDYGGKDFVDRARKIIQNDVIVLFLSYSDSHLKWVPQYKNALFCNEPYFYEEYLESFTDEMKLRELIKKLENHYKVKFNFDNNFLYFPLYKTEGFYSDLYF